jgi:hypothetical protein
MLNIYVCPDIIFLKMSNKSIKHEANNYNFKVSNKEYNWQIYTVHVHSLIYKEDNVQQ